MRITAHFFSAVVLHSRKKDTVIFSGPKKHEHLYSSLQFNLAAYVQDLLPGILPSDLFTTPTQLIDSDVKYQAQCMEMERGGLTILEDIFADVEAFPSLIGPNWQNSDEAETYHQVDSYGSYRQV